MGPEYADSPSIKKRASRYVRAQGVRRAGTRRLEEILLTVHRYRVVDREIVQLLHFTPSGRTAAQRVLTNLWWSRYLDKLSGRAVNDRDVYFLSGRSRPGLKVLYGLVGEDAVRTRLKRPPRIEHALAVNELRARIEVSARQHGMEVEGWKDELDLANLAGDHIVPDAFFTVVREEDGKRRVAGFFIEMEIAAVSRRHWRSRLTRYTEFYYSGRYEEVFGVPSLRLLVVVPGGGRQSTSILEEAQAVEFTPLRVTTWDLVLRATPEAVLIAPIWRRPGELADGPLYQLSAEVAGFS